MTKRLIPLALMALLAASPLNAQEPPAPKPDVPESGTGGAEATAEADAITPRWS
ncbi:hypothetical protein QWZ10_13715 [Paracoccus cavernae]|uniref:Uncharacterized protein n=1 Tax=Paracoccus cavernae TaxID=1571207 RepID=A0ABT8D9K7_9RHOB|nr:hypothetical protein [Paracoccus cavernae]